MSIEHSVICDGCGSVLAAAPTVPRALADATLLGARRTARHDLCPDCATERGEEGRPAAAGGSQSAGIDRPEVQQARLAEQAGGVGRVETALGRTSGAGR